MDKEKSKTVQDALDRLRKRMDECRAVRPGYIDLHLSGVSGGEYRISFEKGKTMISSTISRDAARGPLFEVWGNADTIRAIIDGEKDPVKQFLAGSMRVRGNLRYLSEVGVVLGILDKPL